MNDPRLAFGVFALILVAAALLTALLTPLAGLVARRLGAVDAPGGRRVHKSPTPRMGGLALFLALIGVTGLLFLIEAEVILTEQTRVIWVLLGALIVVATGVWDDVAGAKPYVKLAMQVIVSILLFFAGIGFESISWPFVETGRIHLGVWGLPLTVIWIAGLMNAVNLIDGLDGLCSGICAISSLTLAAIIAGYDQTYFAFLPFITAGLCIGFLFHNYNPAKIFLGDTGSLLLGYLLACITMTTGQKSTAVFTLLVPMICIAIPIFDTALAIVRRAALGRHPFSADKDHIHHRLLSLGLSQKRVVWILWYVTAYLGLAGYTLEKANSPLLVLANAAFLLFGMVFIAENLNVVVRDRRQLEDHHQSLQKEMSELRTHSSSGQVPVEETGSATHPAG